jgi:hypothetical protein
MLREIRIWTDPLTSELWFCATDFGTQTNIRSDRVLLRKGVVHKIIRYFGRDLRFIDENSYRLLADDSLINELDDYKTLLENSGKLYTDIASIIKTYLYNLPSNPVKIGKLKPILKEDINSIKFVEPLIIELIPFYTQIVFYSGFVSNYNLAKYAVDKLPLCFSYNLKELEVCYNNIERIPESLFTGLLQHWDKSTILSPPEDLLINIEDIFKKEPGIELEKNYFQYPILAPN